MMSVREVRVRMGQRFVPMGVRVTASNRPLCMLVQVVLVVFVLMVVLLGMVGVRVVVPLGQMQPHPRGHQGACRQQTRRDRLTQPGHGERCTEERRDRKVRPPCARCPGAAAPRRTGSG